MTNCSSTPPLRIAAFLSEHLCWSAFWDKQTGVWRVSQDDPDADLHAESGDADTVASGT